MSYEISILRKAQKELEKLPANVYQRICESILQLAETPRPVGFKKLSGREGWRTRVGDYRIIYSIDDECKEIRILHIGHRRDVYR